ncbi:MAG: D-alanyl-D-alanine carboxypeptidase (penicillin-binding protein 5/6) [Gammaproteobacteria bacterium]|jgi:D-alanyl-D-alanine carboxypeptidase (penicillin-binding protein 5/6)
MSEIRLVASFQVQINALLFLLGWMSVRSGLRCLARSVGRCLWFLPLGAALAGPVPAPPQLAANSWLLQDHDSGTLIAEHNADERVEPASLTKILTMYVVMSELAANKIQLDDLVLVSKKAWKMPGSRMFIEVDTKVTVSDLIKGVVIQSGNDASVALAEHVAGDETSFSDLMNQYAKRIGLDGSHFVNASGLPDPQHYTTARDMARLAHALIRDFPQHYPLHKQKEFVYNGITQYNRNKLLWQDASVDGLKTGHTEAAGYCLVASAQREGMRLVSVVMGASSDRDRARQSSALLAYGFRFYETQRLYQAGKPIRDVRVWKGASELASLGLRENLFVTIPRGQYQQLKPSIEIAAQLQAPLIQGDVHGTLRVSLDDALIVERELVVLGTVEKGGLWRQASDTVRMMFE